MDDAELGQGIAFALSEDGRKLLASYTPVETKAVFDSAWIKRQIALQGHDDLFLFDAALALLVERYREASEPFSLEIGEARDASAAVEVAPDKMEAYLTLTPAWGGEAATRERIARALAEKQVTAGILEDNIDSALAAGEASRLVVAQGHEAVDGEDGRLQCLIETVRERHPRLDEHGIAHYRDLGGIVTVHVGERLMEKIPPTPGQAGENVLGQVIPAKAGKEAMFASGLKGARVDPENPAFLLAETPGQPVLAKLGVMVEPTVTLADVDLNCGNLDFDGSVNITGDVQAGMSIQASGDIHVGGTVEAALLVAGGDVVIKGGIIGHGEVREHPDDGEKTTVARVRCGGSCSAHFIENASVETGDSILVDEFVMQSELAAVNQIVVGKPGSGKGRIIGGLAEATLLVQTAVIGSPAGVKTRVMVGMNPYLHEKLRNAAKQLEAEGEELVEVDKLLHFIDDHPGRLSADVCDKARNTRQALLQKIELALEEKSELSLQVELAAGAKVVVEKAVFNNVQIEIGGQIHWVDLGRNGGTFFLAEEGIEFQ